MGGGGCTWWGGRVRTKGDSVAGKVKRCIVLLGEVCELLDEETVVLAGRKHTSWSRK